MKKFLLSSLIVTSIAVFAYTQTDVDNATYLAGKGIITSQSTTAGYRLDDTITRAEVVAIALKIKGIQDPASYKCKKYFSDTVKNDWICRAVEMAADNDLVSRSNTKFRPQERITRAEAFAMLFKTVVIQIGERGLVTYGDRDITSWQKNLFLDIYASDLAIPGMTKTVSPWALYFYPNRPATRAEIFAFAKNILEYKAKIMSDEVTTQ